MIVKVQLEITSSHQNHRVLIYNKDRSVLWEGDATKELMVMMKGTLKAFFEAKIKNRKIILGRKIPQQEW